MSTRTIAAPIDHSEKALATIDFEPEAEICRAFANPMRLQILDQICQGECSATHLQKSLHISRANLSQHTSLLKSVGLIAKRRYGNQMHFSLAMPEVKQAFEVLRKVLHARLAESKRLWE